MSYCLISIELEKNYSQEEYRKLVDSAAESTLSVPGSIEEHLISTSKYYDAILYPHSPYFQWNMEAWPMLLRLARTYDWQPEREPYEMGQDEIGEYPVVSERDACALADALERATPDIPDERISSYTTLMSGPVEFIRRMEKWWEAQGYMLAFFSDSVKHSRLFRFIGFCREGAFKIN